MCRIYVIKIKGIRNVITNEIIKKIKRDQERLRSRTKRFEPFSFNFYLLYLLTKV